MMSLHDAADPALYDSSPPEEPLPLSPLIRAKRRLSGRLSAVLLPLVKRAARPYVGGDTVGEALCVVDRLAREGFGTTLGYWDRGQDSARRVAELYIDTMDCLALHERDCYVSLKPPPLRFSPDLARELASTAAYLGMRLHCDSHGVETAVLSNEMLEVMAERLETARLGTTLPGRWSRSLTDADWAVACGFNVRVVKGQWPDPAEPHRDIRTGYLAVVGRLAGRAHHVSVATHDFALARESIGLLRSAGTACDIELLLGMPCRQIVGWARENGVKVRIYVPYGAGFVPNAVGILKRNPRLLLAVAKEQAASLFSRT
jgi:proline dehydrogenase